MDLFSKLGALLKQNAAEKADLKKRYDELYIRQKEMENELQEKRDRMEDELRKKRDKVETEILTARGDKLLELDNEIAKLRNKRLEDVAKAEQTERERIRADIAKEEQAERGRIRAEIAKEREYWQKELEDSRKQLNAERIEFDKQKGAVSAWQSEITRLKTELENSEKIMEQEQERERKRLERLLQKKKEEMDSKYESQLEEERESLKSERQSVKEENARLREELDINKKRLGVLEQLERRLGDKDPRELLRELNEKTKENNSLKEELALRPTEEGYESLKTELKRKKALVDDLNNQIAARNADAEEAPGLRLKKNELEEKIKTLEYNASLNKNVIKEAESQRDYLQEQLNKLRATSEPEKIEEERKRIENPRFPVGKAKNPVEVEDEIDEIAWLKDIGKKCDEYGVHFNKRILYSFHTALKTAEWSPLTILAGVSGTGKSELPRLYSHFGGLYYEMLSVQPNWDSKEFMLGFFNSIDNKYEAQPVLRFLAQSQKEWEEKGDETYPGLNKAVCLVLLDEMNLAHPELYFAEFLSKLESRRGMKNKRVPTLPVKIGAKMPDYELPLGRNVLWTGTMNQDETTKSLSDKVLDRSIIIHFPRPIELKSRQELKDLNDFHEFSPLHRGNWDDWWVDDTSSIKDYITPYKKYLEEINAALAASGRAIGHRVWQSIEYYMANYPEVRAAVRGEEINKTKLDAAMHTAFEDQLVQKVMPKLRGIDTRGKIKEECLDKIEKLITEGVKVKIDGKSESKLFDLVGDFKLACEIGHGQFIWQTANYIKDDSTADNSKKEAKKTEGEK